MTKEGQRDDRADEVFVERVREHYAAPALSHSQQAAFDRRLEARLTRSLRSSGIPLPIASMVAAGLLLGLLSVFRGPDRIHDPIEPSVFATNDEALDLRSESVLGVFAFGIESEVDATLSEEYEAIESLFLGS